MDFVVKLRGLPWSATIDDVLEFFGPECQILHDREGIHLVKTIEGRATGECFVEPLTERDLDFAMTKNRSNMGHRYIEVFKVKKAEMDWILKRARPDTYNVNSSSIQRALVGQQPSPLVEHLYTSTASENETYIRLRGLPFEATEDDIVQFFHGLEIAPNGIHIVTDYTGKVTGEAYCQFGTRDDAELALQRDRECIGHRYVELFRVTIGELRTTVRSLIMLNQRNRRNALYNTRPTPYERPVQRRVTVTELVSRPHVRVRSLVTSRPVSRYYATSIASKNGSLFARGYAANSWNDYTIDDLAWEHRESVSGFTSSPLPPPPPPNQPPPLIPGLKSSNRRELYLHMRGLPWSATEADIRAFFAPIQLRAAEILFDDTNRPSGSARAYFTCQEDINLAMRKNREKIGSRYIELFND